MFLAGIVLYNPSIERLESNIKAIKSQVEKVFLVDNGSINGSEINKLLESYPNIEVRYNRRNEGIAYALNEIFEFAQNNSYKYVLTLDQDSIVACTLIEEYSKYLCDIRPFQMLTCRIEDRNFVLQESNSHEVEIVNSAITSGSLVSVESWNLLGGFDDSMFIDFVDNDFCYRLCKAGGEIRKINSTYIIHELGHSKIVYPFGIQQIIYNHTPFRCYYIIRNRIYYGRKHLKSWQYFRNLLAVIWRFLLILIYESQKKEKLRSMVKGFCDGFKMIIPYERKNSSNLCCI